MEVITIRYEKIQQALRTLGKGISRLEKVDKADVETEQLLRDGVIQRFEYCIDGFWKFLNLWLELRLGVVVEVSAPREVLRLSLDNRLITQDEKEILTTCIKDRNLTSHTYNQDLAEKIEAHIPVYYTTMNAIITRIKID